MTPADRDRIANDLRNVSGLVGLAERGVHCGRTVQAKQHVMAARAVLLRLYDQLLAAEQEAATDARGPHR